MTLIKRAALCLLPLLGLGLPAAPAPAQFLDSIPHSSGPEASEFFIARNAALSLCPRLVLGEEGLDPADFGLSESAAMMGPDFEKQADRYFGAGFEDHTVRIHYDPAWYSCQTTVTWDAGASRMPTMRSIETSIRREGFSRLSQDGGRSEYEKQAPDGVSYWYYVIVKEANSYSITFMAER